MIQGEHMRKSHLLRAALVTFILTMQDQRGFTISLPKNPGEPNRV
jgi:hypothetical protein